MIDEHFGISLVEFLASGLIVVAHNSAGPKMDILNISPLSALLSNTTDRTQSIDKLPMNFMNDSRPQLPLSKSDEELDIVMLETPKRISNNEDDCIAASFGYLCQTADGFAVALYQCLTDAEESIAMLKRVPSALKRFNNNKEFGRNCIRAMDIHRLLQ